MFQSLQARVLIFYRFACFWPKGYQRGSSGKSHQNGDQMRKKQAMRKNYPPTGFEPAAFGLPVHCSTTTTVFVDLPWTSALVAVRPEASKTIK